ncbi:Phage-like element PBSX protein, XkdF [uncultured Caudovirales phage]|uniref:Phage-like element PBSX protein, XkdF n=1 Tax=uncultured Caudovirales phage TaxID=2100421 RepID=A0A6J7WLI9_9CAUD|nr:Phage-like element PBSX protein, XkdF [uncultured Caudovirales phage]
MIKREKVFELKIEEDDDVSGIDSISLVDEPAIEVNWVSFSKEKEHEFHIPDGEDEAYLDMLISKGEKEEDLLEEFEVEDIEYLHKNSFVKPHPNAPSELDGPEYKIRYKYVLNPEAGGSKVIKTTRQFCKTLIFEDLVWRVEDMEQTLNQFGQSALVWRGGYNCRHVWAKIKYKSKNLVPKKAIDKREEGYDILGLPQPDTRTKNPSFSKEDFQKISVDYDGTLSTNRGELMAGQLMKRGNDVYIVTARHSSEGTPVYAVADRLGIPHDKIFFTGGKPKWMKLKELGIQRHIDNNPNVIADIKKHLPLINAEQFDYNVGSIGGYVDPDIKKKKPKVVEKGISKPTLFENEYEYLFNKDKNTKQYFAQDSEKQIVLGPAMIPNQKIFRKDNQGNPYFVFFTPETIKMIAQKYMKNKYIDNNDQMHDGKAVKDVFVTESWIKESENDKSTDYGFGDLPVGTWFVSMKINNKDIWDKVKSRELNGFSVSGFFEEVAAFRQEQIFLEKVAEILKGIVE